MMKTWYIRWFNLKKGPQNHRSSAKNSLKSITPHRYRLFLLLKSSEMASLSNSRSQSRKERPDRSQNKQRYGRQS